MDNIILHNYSLKNISFSRPERISKNTTLFYVKYNNKQKFLIQTPKISIAKILNKNKIIDQIRLIINNQEYCDLSKKFIKSIKEIDSYIKNKSEYFFKKFYLSKNNKKFIQSVYTKNK